MDYFLCLNLKINIKSTNTNKRGILKPKIKAKLLDLYSTTLVLSSSTVNPLAVAVAAVTVKLPIVLPSKPLPKAVKVDCGDSPAGTVTEESTITEPYLTRRQENNLRLFLNLPPNRSIIASLKNLKFKIKLRRVVSRVKVKPTF